MSVCRSISGREHLGERHLQAIDDASGNVIDDREDIARVPVVAVGPEMAAVRGAHQLRRDPDPFPRLPHGAFDHGIDAEASAEVAYVRFRAGGMGRRRARDEAKPGHLAKAGEQFVRQAAGEVLDIAIGTEIRERQDGQRRGSSRSIGSRRREPAVDPYCCAASIRSRCISSQVR